MLTIKDYPRDQPSHLIFCWSFWLFSSSPWQRRYCPDSLANLMGCAWKRAVKSTDPSENHRKSRRCSMVFPRSRLARESQNRLARDEPRFCIEKCHPHPWRESLSVGSSFQTVTAELSGCDVKIPMFLFNRAIQQVWFLKQLSKVLIWRSIFQ